MGQAYDIVNDERMTSSRRWTIIGLLCVGFMVAYFDRVNLSVAVTDPTFQSHFHLSKEEKGRLLSAFFVSLEPNRVQGKPTVWKGTLSLPMNST